MKTWLVAAIAVVISVITIPAATEAQNHRQERVMFAKGTSSALIKGQLKGEETVDYALRAGAGQTHTVTLKRSHGANYFHLLPPSSTDVGMFIGQIGGDYEGILPTDGDYTIRVCLICSAAGSENDSARSSQTRSSNNTAHSQVDTIELEGIVVYKDLEGGFFAIAGDDGRTYDPVNLPEAFKENGMRVKATVRVKNDVAGIRMVGEVVEIVEIVEFNGQAIPMEAQDTPSDAPREFQTKTGKTIIVSETHPVGRSLSTIAISTQNFEHDFREVYEDQDPISDIFLADLDANGFDELYIITTSTGSGSYGNVLAFASNKDKSLSMVHFPALEKGDPNFEGYVGHDTFKLEDQKLVRLFPIYIEGDTNQNPTGGTRKLIYDLLPGEAMWQLKVKIARPQTGTSTSKDTQWEDN